MAVVLLEIWFGEKLFCVFTCPAVTSANSSCAPSLKVPRARKLSFFTGCWITAALPVSHEQPYLDAGDDHSR